MKTPEGAIRDLLLADPAVAALVGNRIHQQTLPDATAEYPCITLWVQDDQPADTNHDGSGGLFFLVLQISAWARPTAGKGGNTVARELAWAVREALLGRRVIVGNVELQSITGGRMEAVPPSIEIDLWQYATDYDVTARVSG